MNPSHWIGVLLSALVSLTALHARATVMREVPLDELITSADVVVLGTVVESEVVLEDRGLGPQPETRTTIAVREVLRGSAGERVVVRELGGVTQALAYRIDGIPEYRVGEEVVVFLVRHPEVGGEHRTLAMAQGRFVVERGVPGVPSIVRRDLEGIAFAAWAEGQMRVEEPGAAPAVELGGFLDRIRRGGAR